MSAVEDIELFRRSLRAEGPVLVDSPEDFRRVIGVMAARFDGLTDPMVSHFVVATGPDSGPKHYAWFECAEADVVYAGFDDTIKQTIDRLDANYAPAWPAHLVDAALEWGGAERVFQGGGR